MIEHYKKEIGIPGPGYGLPAEANDRMFDGDFETSSSESRLCSPDLLYVVRFHELGKLATSAIAPAVRKSVVLWDR